MQHYLKRGLTIVLAAMGVLTLSLFSGTSEINFTEPYIHIKYPFTALAIAAFCVAVILGKRWVIAITILLLAMAVVLVGIDHMRY